MTSNKRDLPGSSALQSVLDELKSSYNGSVYSSEGDGRISTTQELDTLRDIIHSHEVMRDYLHHERQQYRTKSKEIYKRFRAQVHICESILSEYTAAESYLHLIQEQETKVRADLDKLQTLFHVHPISRLPFEVLQYIFQLVVESADDRTPEPFRVATQLSQVSQSWRDVALRTPTFWTRMFVSMRSKPAALKKYFSRTAARIGDLGVRISLTDSAGDEDEALVLFSCRLDWLSKIEYLDILPATRAGLEFIIKAISFLPKVDVEHICISQPRAESTERAVGELELDRSRTNIAPVFQNFSGIRSFSMDNVRFPIFVDTNVGGRSTSISTTLSGVQHVAIGNVEELSILSLARCFPEAVTLSLMSITRLTDEIGGYIISGNGTSPFSRLEDLMIEDLGPRNSDRPSDSSDGNTEEGLVGQEALEVLVKLMTNLPSLRHVYIQDSPQLLERLDGKTSRIRTLTTNRPEALAEISLRRMTQLRQISLHHGEELSDVTFERIVKGHCMRKRGASTSKPMSTATSRSRSHSRFTSNSTFASASSPIVTPTSSSTSRFSSSSEFESTPKSIPNHTEEHTEEEEEAKQAVSLRILVLNQISATNLPWLKTELFSLAKKEESFEERGGSIYRTYTLAWT